MRVHTTRRRDDLAGLADRFAVVGETEVADRCLSSVARCEALTAVNVAATADLFALRDELPGRVASGAVSVAEAAALLAEAEALCRAATIVGRARQRVVADLLGALATEGLLDRLDCAEQLESQRAE